VTLLASCFGLTEINRESLPKAIFAVGSVELSRRGRENMFKIVFTAGVAVAMASASMAQDAGVGAKEYMIACAGCHGESGKGDGPLAGLLDIETPNLTMLTEQAGGTFPYEAALLVVDGRNDIRAHGSDMPVWGDRFFVSAATSDSLDPAQAELVAKGRMLALVGYLRSIQGN
jgi:mono/diheme cytochrome c family protein